MTSAPNDRYANVPHEQLTLAEHWQLLTLALIELARASGVEVTDELTTVFSCERGSLWNARDYAGEIVTTPVFGRQSHDVVTIKIRRVTRPVTTDGSLDTSQSDGPVKPTGRSAINDRGDVK